MVPLPKQNEFNIAQRLPKQRPSLETMRSRLASSPPQAEAKPQKPKGKSRGPGAKPLAAMLALVAVLAGANVLIRSHKQEILEAIGVQTLSTPLATPAGLSLDDRARFWAYAAFDAPQLRARFKVPASALIDPVDARHHLEGLLAQPLGADARTEALALKQASGKGTGP